MATDRARARDAVLEGRVLVSGSVATKPDRMVDPAEPIELSGPPRRFVSRGGEKLDGALDAFGVDVRGRRCLDVGSSTGGFTDCLLQRGAREVVAVDVGRGQLDWGLRQDPRVTVMERTDVRDLDVESLGDFELVVVDVSFISLRTVLPLIADAAGDAAIVALVKPQFEVGRERVGRRGVVTDIAAREKAVADVIARAGELGLDLEAQAPAVLLGAEGNQEYFVLLRRRT
jgi:23S rRNA (cytidine1920-2'-O)/16S rRNA (cytidine1409-2'-O)-methyltransferase